MKHRWRRVIHVGTVLLRRIYTLIGIARLYGSPRRGMTPLDDLMQPEPCVREAAAG
jgi:hypothetical protein